ncbi:MULTISPECIES: hypothetical protein [unclassified Kribbella]|uniref:hypothetical protein n=1 Tax=unclassified Kribbella TaxID=2644121 RepID=UPI00340CF2EB
MPLRRLITIAVAALASLALLGCEPIETTQQGSAPNSRPSKGKSTGTTTTSTSRATVKITAADSVCWAGQIGRGTKKGCGSATLSVKDSGGNYRILLRKTKGNGNLTVVFTVNGKRVNSGSITSSSGIVSISYATG